MLPVTGMIPMITAEEVRYAAVFGANNLIVRI